MYILIIVLNIATFEFYTFMVIRKESDDLLKIDALIISFAKVRRRINISSRKILWDVNVQYLCTCRGISFYRKCIKCFQIFSCTDFSNDVYAPRCGDDKQMNSLKLVDANRARLNVGCKLIWKVLVKQPKEQVLIPPINHTRSENSHQTSVTFNTLLWITKGYATYAVIITLPLDLYFYCSCMLS